MFRSPTFRHLLVAAVLATGPALSFAMAAPQAAAEIRFSGGVWRGSVGDRIEVAFREGGRDQTVTGVLAKLERYAMTLTIEVGGRSASKVVILGDVKSVKLVSAGSAESAPAADTKPVEGDGSTPPKPDAAPDGGKSGATPPTPAARGGTAIEHPDTAGPITGPRADGKKTVFVLPLPGMVGVGLRHEEMERVEKEADKLGPGQIVIMRINSGGGLVTEGDEIHVVLNRLKKKHRLVAWIEEAISGAAFTGLHADEIYFMDVGSLGAITMFAGATSITGRQLEAWLEKVFEVGESGGRDGHVIRCMVYSPLECSYDVDEETGKVTWYQDTSGKYVLSNKEDNLTFTATDAVRSKFAQGRANSEYELFKAMQLVDGTYVVSNAGKRFAEDWQKAQDGAKYEVPRLMMDYQIKGASRDAEAALGVRINAIKKLLTWWDRAPNTMAYELQAPPRERLQEMLKQLQKELADLQKQKARERKG